MDHDDSGPQRNAEAIQGLSLRQIEIFHAVYQTRSISAASRMLTVSQPVVSRTVKRLEDVLGITLFQRSAKGLMPTMEAQLIFDEVDGMVRRVEGLGARIEEIASGRTVAFRMGGTASVARGLLPRALQALGGQGARPDLFFDVLSVDQIVDYLLDGTGQCVVTLAPIDHPMLTAEKLGIGHLVAVIPRDHPLAAVDRLTPAHFAGAEVITFQVDGPHQRAIRSFLGAEPVVERTVVRFADTAVSMATEGMAIALVDSFTTMAPMGERAVLRQLDGAPVFSVYLQWNPNRPISGHVAELRRLLSRDLDGMKGSGQSA